MLQDKIRILVWDRAKEERGFVWRARLLRSEARAGGPERRSPVLARPPGARLASLFLLPSYWI